MQINRLTIIDGTTTALLSSSIRQFERKPGINFGSYHFLGLPLYFYLSVSLEFI